MARDALRAPRSRVVAGALVCSYRRSFAFPIDFVTTVPFDTIIELSQGGGPGSGGGDAVRLVRIGKGLKVTRSTQEAPARRFVRGGYASW